MSRLIGKQSDDSWYAVLLLVVAIATTGSFEYLGIINLIPGFEGADRQASNLTPRRS